MQEKFANRATKITTTTTTTTSNKKTGQIDTPISKYDEMLYMPKSIEKRRPVKKCYVNSIDVACETVYNFSGALKNGRRRNRLNDDNYDVDNDVVLKYTKFSQKVFITLIVLWLWPFGGIGSVGFVHCDNSVNVFANENFSSKTIEPINRLLASSATMPSTTTTTTTTTTPSPSPSSSTIAKQAHVTQSQSNVLNTLNDKRSEYIVDGNHEVDHSTTSSYEHQNQQEQHQQRISIIKTRSKKTKPNASFSLDLFKPNTNSERVQYMQSNHTLNRLDEHDTNRIPDVMNVRESQHHHHHHHHHSVIKRFRAFVSKRYHFSAKKPNDNSNILQLNAPSKPKTNSIDRRRPIETPAPLKHLIYVLSSIDDDDNDEHQPEIIENAQKIHEIVRQHTTSTNFPHLNTNTILTLINRTNVLLQDLREKHFDDKNTRSKAITSQSITTAVKIPSKHKRSIDLQPNEKQKQNSIKTTKQPFDDHFFNSKLKNYYFLYQLDNISNYNNHFDLLNSPSNYNATNTQIQINKQQHIQFSNQRQIDKNVSQIKNVDTIKNSDFLKYNPSEQKTLNFSNNHSNHIKRILLAKIASICLNCVDATDSSVVSTTDSNAAPGDDDADVDGKVVNANDSPVKIYILPRSLRSVTNTVESDHQKLFRFINDQTNTNNNLNDDNMEWNESMLQQSLKNYPRIAGLLGNLSLAKIPNQFNYRQKQNLHSIDNDKKNLTIDNSDIVSNNVNQTIATILSTRHNNSNSILLLKLSSNNNNLTKNNNDVVKSMTTPIRANNAAKHISINNYSPISTFEHYIRIISSRNINNRKNYYAIQMNGNKSKSLNFQDKQQEEKEEENQHLKQAKFQRVKKQQQIIKLFATNHRFTLNNDTMNDNNNRINENDENYSVNINVDDDHNTDDATDTKNIVNNSKLNFTLNQNNCTIKVFNFDKINSKNVKNQNTIATAAIDNDNNDNVKKKKGEMNDQFDSAKSLASINDELTLEKQSNVNHINAESMINGKISRKIKKNDKEIDNKASRSSTNALNSYLMRLESIKYQILMKLGLKQKPNITTTLPKHVIMDTLYRADDNNLPQSNENEGRRGHHRKQHGQKQRHKQKQGHKQKQKQKHSKLNKNAKHKLMPPILLNEDPNQNMYQFEQPQFSNSYNKNDINSRSNSDEDKFPFAADIFADETNDIESDDFYGRTREIIIFAEKGSYFNHQPLIEFVSTNGLDESDNSNTANSDAISKTAQLNHTTSLLLSSSSSSSLSSQHQVNNSSDNKLKKRIKCKGDIIENRQVRKRKRRRRQVDNVSDVKEIAQSKPVILVSNEKQILEKMVVKSSSSSPASKITSSMGEQTQYQQSNFDFNLDTRVRRAFLWIKVDEMQSIASKNKKKSNKNHKSKGKHRHRNNIHRNFFRLWVFRIDEPSLESNQHIKLSASKSVHVSRLGWQKLDVTSTVRQWYADGGKTRLRFLVDCSGCVDRFKIHLFDGKPTKNSKTRAKPNLLQNDKLNGSSDPVRPFLVIYTDPHVIKRVRRHTPDCSVAKRGQCCKQKFYVSFAELGWEDWIIAPHGYYANYCQGNCNGMRTPDNFRSYHSHVIEEYRKMNRLTGLQPCCTPLKFSSMSLIYYEENQKIIKRDLPKMVVDECGCP